MANRTYRLTQQGQITERYTKAIEQLGSDKLDVRLGGIYALERIATDSKRDHPTVVEVLSAFVREHSQPSTGDDDKGGEPTTDVLAAVTVLGRLPQRTQVSRGNLEGAYVESAELEHAHLERANLRGAHLRGANLDWAHLEGAILQRAHLEGAYLQHAHLQGADLLGANLEGAKLWGTKLRGANLDGAQLQGATYDADTVWPVGFNWEAAGVREES